MTPAQEFRALRQRLCLTGEALARALHVSGSRNVRRWEAGDIEPPWAVLELMRLWADPRLPKSLRPNNSPSTK
jgi:DNA-binding transcriptional regulator YiaG